MAIERSRSQEAASDARGANITCPLQAADFFFEEESDANYRQSTSKMSVHASPRCHKGYASGSLRNQRAKHRHKYWIQRRHRSMGLIIDTSASVSNGIRARSNNSGVKNKSRAALSGCVICVETILKSLFICILISLQCYCMCMQTTGTATSDSTVEGHALNERSSNSHSNSNSNSEWHMNEMRASSKVGDGALALGLHHQLGDDSAVLSEENSEMSQQGKHSVPRITIQPNDLIAIEGESAELNCDAEGEPEPIIEWYHNGELIKSSTHTRTTMGGSIQFLDIHPSSDRLAMGQQQQQTTTSGGAPVSGRRASDEGIYYCVARNSLGQARSRNATLQVAYIRDEFKVSPKDRTVSLGDSVSFECMPHAWPEPSFQWRHNGRPIEPSVPSSSSSQTNNKYTVQRIAQAETIRTSPSPKGSADSDSNGGSVVELIGSQLVIKNADKSDAGQYTCLAETKGSHRMIERESRAAHLNVLVKPFFIEAPMHISAQVGEQVSLRCRMGGEPEPVISWRKQNGQPLSDKTRIDPIDKTLTLEHLSVADSATYVCEGENSVGSAKSVATVSVQSRPKFTVQPNDQEVELGSRVQLKCAGEASPQPILFWYKEGHRQLMFAPSSATLSKRQQQVNNAQPQNQHPQAAALVGPQSNHDYRGYSSIPNGDTSPAINKLFTTPLNQAEQQQSYSSNYFGNRIFVDNQGSLNIINVTSSDNGYYACALISQIGSVLAKAKLTVKDSQHQTNPYGSSDYRSAIDPLQAARSSSLAPMIGKYDLLPPPVIKLGAENQTLPTNTSATLLCDVVSQVAFKIQWFFESQPLQEDPPRVTILDSGALSLNNLRTSDTGVYTCVVTAANDQIMPIANSYEPLDTSMLTTAPPVQQSTSHSAMLKVVSPMNPNIQFYRMDTFANPSAPGPAYLISTNENDAITIAWSAPADSGMLPIKEYIVEHYDTSQEHLGWRVIYKVKGKELLKIDGLSPDGSHFFVIRAANGHGVGPSSAIAGPMRTAAGEARYQLELQRRRNQMDLPGSRFDMSDLRPETTLARERLMTIGTNLIELTPISSSSVRLQWSTQPLNSSSGAPMEAQSYLSSVGVDTFLEGYSIRYRAVGIGESLLSKPRDSSWNPLPSSLPLVTSYVPEDQEETTSRSRREVPVNSYYDYSQEFNEVRVVDHNTEHYTINGLKPFTVYQFFVVPYYKDIDGVPSNILAVQTNEDRPSVAPPNLTIRPVNNTTIRLLWLHIPASFSNGILRGYVIRMNKTEGLGASVESNKLTENDVSGVGGTKTIHVPLASLSVAPLTLFDPESRIQPNFNGIQQYVVMYDITNLNYKSFYSVQVAGATSVGPGPWSEAQNFVMEPSVLSQSLRASTNEFDDVISKSIISTLPYPYESSTHLSSGISQNWYYIIPICLLIVSVILMGAFLVYQRNNQKLVTWKKAISERFTNKFYIPSVVDHRGPSSLQQNIYDHQQHLIYSGGSSHMVVGPSVAAAVAAAAHSHQHQHHTQIHGMQVQPGTIWANNGNNNCLNSSATGSLSSHGGLLPLSSDPGGNVGGGGMRKTSGGGGNGEQILLMNTSKDTNPRFVKNDPTTIHSLVNHHQASVDSSRSYVGGAAVAANHPQQHQHQLHQQHHLGGGGGSSNGGGGGDYYSVINNAAEYEELDQQQRNNMRMATSSSIVVDRHQAGSSNSDTSCPSSVTRLIPNSNQNFNREYLTKNALMDSQRQELIVQQQMGVYRENKQQQPFVTMLNGGGAIINNNANGADFSQNGRVSAQHQTMVSSLSPYATTNLASQVAYNQQFMHPNNGSHNVTLSNQIGQNFMHTNGGGAGAGISTMDDASSRFMMNNTNNQAGAMSSFRTLQRQPVSIQTVTSRQFNPTISTASSTAQVQSRMMHAVGSPDPRQFHPMNHTTLVNNPLNDVNMNLYEHIEYNGSNYGVLPGQALQQQQQQQQQQAHRYHQQRQPSTAQQSSNDLISSSTSSGSVKSSTAHNQQSDQQTKSTKSGPENEAHDLRVFSSAANNGKSTTTTTASSAADCELAPLNDPDSNMNGSDDGNNNDIDSELVDETTAFRQKPTDSNQRVRQLSKRKRQQQRNRLHNQNQKLG